MPTESIEHYLSLIARQLPGFRWTEARHLADTGQFNVVLCLDEAWIFRFPRSEHVAAELARELEILPRLQGKLPIAIPNPQYAAYDPENGMLLFMAYALLPGEPLLRQRFAALAQDTAIVDRIAGELAGFLLSLHRLPPADIGFSPEHKSARQAWREIYDEMRQKLFRHMRAEAREAVTSHFERALQDETLWCFTPCPIHGDFGTGNILYQNGHISGILDWSFCELGDPAQDLGALLSSYGELFIEAVFRDYPALREHLPRARFYRENYALIQALYALRDDNLAEFEDGIAAYR